MHLIEKKIVYYKLFQVLILAGYPACKYKLYHIVYFKVLGDVKNHY